ncbi:MAG TPA: hypothetical protein VH500_16165 [Nitrososphaeraceae archaeon]
MKIIGNDNVDYDGRKYHSQWKWFFIFIAIGIVISLTVPFPISFAVYILMFFLINALRMDYHLRKYGVRGGIGELSKSLFTTTHDSNDYSGPEEYGYSPLKFYCMKCGKEHKERACPRCGSTAVTIT